MTTYEIQRSVWTAFLNTFSKQHYNQTATLLLVSEDLGPLAEAQGVRFGGISIDAKGSGRDTIRILLGTETHGRMEHMIAHPLKIWMRSDAEKNSASLVIESWYGPKAILELQPQLTQRQLALSA